MPPVVSGGSQYPEFEETLRYIPTIETDTAVYWIKPTSGWYNANLAHMQLSSEYEEKLLKERIDAVFYFRAPPGKTVAEGVDKEQITIFQSKYNETFELIKKTKGELWFSEGMLLIDVLLPDSLDAEDIKQKGVLILLETGAASLAIISILDFYANANEGFWMNRRKFLKLGGGLGLALLLGDHAYSIETGKNSLIDKAVEMGTSKKAPRRMPPMHKVWKSNLYYAVLVTTLERYVQGSENLKPKTGKKPNIYLVGIEHDDPNLVFFKNNGETKKVLKNYKALVADKLDDAYFKRLNESGVKVDREAVLSSFSTQIVSRHYYSKNLLGGGSWNETKTKVKFMD